MEPDSNLPGSSSNPQPAQPAQPQPEDAKSQRPKVPLSNWPSIKIVQPPRGRHSPQVDERCFTYCSQTIAGRYHKREPMCRSICIRKVFGHEVRNIVSYKHHPNTRPDGTVKYALPEEGQNVDNILYGESSEGGSKPKEVKHWEEGWYLWMSKSRWAAQEKFDLMSFDLEGQEKWAKEKRKRNKLWAEYEAAEIERKRDAERGRPTRPESDAENRPYDLVPPKHPLPNTSGQSVLLHLPPPLPPIYQQVENLLEPTHKLLGIFRESLASGDQKKLAGKLWEKAWTTEPFTLASNACSQMWQRWKDGPPDDSDTDSKGF